MAVHPVECKYPFSIQGELKENFHKTHFLEQIQPSGDIRLTRSHAYHFQVQAQIAVCCAKVGYFCVWTGKGPALIEVIEAQSEWRLEVEQRLMFFFKGYVCKYLLGFKLFSYCPACSKVCLEEGEIKKNDDFSACCETCDLWFHWKCVAYSGGESYQCAMCKDAEINSDRDDMEKCSVINRIYFSSFLVIMLCRDGWMTGWRDGLRIIDFSYFSH